MTNADWVALAQRRKIKWYRTLWRFGAMLTFEDVGSQFGQLGSAGRTYHLSVWKNPKR